ncbi:hypothetical protein KIPB_009902 [Kipferlia bialata]|uniref:Uncharacterized protein n=1 Tax=Kipferlia bialata TaxID=797122 RepID=A0A391NP66_9EUKA|nr:hypothetical protein KIPB_009902 [Kipferlia bialata]|eukprot:g9902.t1
MYNSTAWEISSEYGPVATDSPQAHQLVTMLGALGVAPFVTDFTTVVAPEFGIAGGFLEYENAQAFFQGSTTVVVTIPLKAF